MATVTLNPSGRAFACEGRQTILDAALAASVPLSYGCSEGTCGLCKARLVSGRIEQVKHHDFALKESEKLNGDFLLCSYAAASPEVVVEATEAGSDADIPMQRIDARIKRPARVAADIAILTVQTPRTHRLRYLAGQNVRLTLGDDATIDLPIASCPCQDRNLEVHLRLADDAFSTRLTGATSFPLPVRIEGPWGRGLALEAKPLTLCLAFDTGVAPARSWIEQQLDDESRARVQLYWFARQRRDFYLANLLSAWADAFDSFRFDLCTAIGVEEVAARLPAALTSQPGIEPEATRIVAAGPDWFTRCVREYAPHSGFAGADLWVHSLALSQSAAGGR